jgi:hypothetical protein
MTRKNAKSSKLVENASRPLGNEKIVPMAYSTRVSLNSGVLGSASNFVFDLSSIHDPDYSGVGHQPTGHDQLAIFFERYQVISVDYQIVFFNRSTSNPARIGIRAMDVPDTDTNPDVLIENGNVQWTLLSLATGGQAVHTFTGTIAVNEVHGISKSQYLANDDYGAQFGSNPNERAFLHIFTDGLGNDTDPVDVAVKLVYRSRLMGSKNIAQS